MLIPLYGFLKGDVLGLVVLAHADDKVRDVARMLQQSARTRVAVHDAPQLRWQGKVLDGELSVAAAGIAALDRIDVE
jgi:hypothetical protein